MRWTSERRSIRLHAGKNGGCSQIAENSKSECLLFRYVCHSAVDKSGKRLLNQWCPWRGICVDILLQSCRGNDSLRRFSAEWTGQITNFGMCVFVHKNKDRCYPFTWTTSTWQEGSRIRLPCGRNGWEMWILLNRRHFLITRIWSANANRTAASSTSAEKCSSHEFPQEQQKKLPDSWKVHGQVIAWRHGGTRKKNGKVSTLSTSSSCNLSVTI